MGGLPVAVKRIATSLLLCGISVTLALQFATAVRLTCPPPRFHALPVSLNLCDPELWPFLTYPLYGSQHYAGEELPQFRLYGVLANSLTEQLTQEDFLLDSSFSFQNMLTAVLEKRMADILDYVRIYNSTHDVPLVALRLENEPYVLMSDGFVPSGKHVIESFLRVEPEDVSPQ
jgi:hypothetical protein